MKRKHHILLFLLIVIAGAIWVFRSCRESENDIRNVVLISIDTCRADYLSCYGFQHKTTPNIDAVAAEGIVFENVLSPAPLTLPAHSSMMTGTIPPSHGVHGHKGYQLGNSNTTLAEILKSNGFSTGAVISTFVMDSQFGLNQGFDTYDDSFDEKLSTTGVVERRGREASDHAISWIEHHKDESFFLFLHYYDPHADYVPPEPFKTRYASNPYAGEIAYTDYCVGLVIDKLKALGLYDSTLIIITSDHGESLGEHGELTHGYFIYDSVLKVPLIFKLPGKNEPERITERVGLIDLFPTVCQQLDIEIPSEVQGIDLSGYFSEKKYEPEQRTFYCESLVATRYDCNPLLGVVADNWKYIQTTRPELYDLSQAPQELNNVIDSQQHMARIMQDKLIQILEEQLSKDSGSNLDWSKQDIKRLESLGYVAGMKEDFKFDQSKNDPKDFLKLHLVDSEIITLMATGRMVSAKEKCLTLIKMYPDYDMVYRYLGIIASGDDDSEKALRHFEKFIELSPDKHEGYTDVAKALNAMDKFAEAIEYLNKAIQLNPDLADNYLNLGLAHARLGTSLQIEGKLHEAVEHLSKALELRPDMIKILNNLAWIKACNKDASLRDPPKAIELAERACQLTDFKNPDFLDTLSAAYASGGKFDKAIETLKKAEQILLSNHQQKNAEQIHKRLELYRQHHPYYE